MSAEQLPDSTLSRRAFVFGGLATAILAVSLAEEVTAQAASLDQAPNSPSAPDARQAAETEKLQAETEEIRSRARQSETFAGQAKEYLGPLSTVLGGVLTGGGVLLSFNQWLQQRRAQAEAARYSQLTKIGDLLHSTQPNERANGAEQLLTTMARSTSLADQLQVYEMAKGALERRELPDEGPIRLGNYERNLIEAFFLVLPAVRESQELHKQAYTGPDEPSGANINAEGINLSGAKLFGQNLRNTHMSRSILRDVRFQNCLLGGENGTNLNGCDLRRAIFIHLSRRNTKEDFGQIWLQGADMRHAIIRTYYLENPNLYKQVAVRAQNIQGLILLGSTDLATDKLKALTDRGAIHVPRDSKDYDKYYDRTRTPPPLSLAA